MKKCLKYYLVSTIVLMFFMTSYADFPSYTDIIEITDHYAGFSNSYIEEYDDDEWRVDWANWHNGIFRSTQWHKSINTNRKWHNMTYDGDTESIKGYVDFDIYHIEPSPDDADSFRIYYRANGDWESTRYSYFYIGNIHLPVSTDTFHYEDSYGYDTREYTGYYKHSGDYYYRQRFHVADIPKTIGAVPYDLKVGQKNGYFKSLGQTQYVPFNKVPDTQFSPIKIRKETPVEFDVQFNLMADATLEIYDQDDKRIYSGQFKAGTNTLKLNKFSFRNGIQNLYVKAYNDYWDYGRKTFQIDVKKDFYSDYVANKVAVNQNAYNVFYPSNATVYFMPYQKDLTDTLSHIKTGHTFKENIITGWNVIQLPARLNNQTFNVYVVSNNKIVEKYHLPVTTINRAYHVSRTEHALYFELENEIDAFSKEGIGIYKKNVSTLGEIVIPLDKNGVATSEYSLFYSDTENDPQKSVKYKYIHDVSGFTNHQGVDKNSNKDLTAPKLTFDKVGLYDLTFSVQDNAKSTNETQFTSYDKWSSPVHKKILVHRRPFADLKILYTKNVSDNLFYIHETHKNGYDVDHSNMPNKGIIADELEWKTVGSNNWLKGIPSGTLSMSNSYIVRYRVQDIENAWSDWAVVHINEANALELAIETVIVPTYPSAVYSGQIVNIESTVYSSSPVSHVVGRLTNGTTVNMTRSSQKDMKSVWTAKYTIPKTLTDGDYNFRSTATNDNGIKAHDDDNVKVVANNAPSVRFVSHSPSAINELDDVIYVARSNDPDGDTLKLDYYIKAPNASNYVLYKSYTGLASGSDVMLKPIRSVVMGDYHLRVVVTDPQGETASAETDFSPNIILNITGVLTPNPALAGEEITIKTDTNNYGERVILNLSALESGKYLELSPIYAVNAVDNVFSGTYIVPLKTHDGTYVIPATVYRTTPSGIVTATTTLELTIKGNIYDLTKPQVKENE